MHHMNFNLPAFFLEIVTPTQIAQIETIMTTINNEDDPAAMIAMETVPSDVPSCVESCAESRVESCVESSVDPSSTIIIKFYHCSY